VVNLHATPERLIQVRQRRLVYKSKRQFCISHGYTPACSALTGSVSESGRKLPTGGHAPESIATPDFGTSLGVRCIFGSARNNHRYVAVMLLRFSRSDRSLTLEGAADDQAEAVSGKQMIGVRGSTS
jgi:hypothetical protein